MINRSGRHLMFGTGDIGIHMSDTSDVALLLFRNLELPAPIGRTIGGSEAKDVEILDSDVVMSFSNTDSIDVLVKCLITIKRKIRTTKQILL